MKKQASVAALIALALSTGCVDRLMTIDSNPEGALVYLNDQEVGRTPLTRDFQQYGNYELEVRKEGFETLRSNQQTQEPWWQLIPLDIITELLPFHYLDQPPLSLLVESRFDTPGRCKSNAR